MNRVWLWLAFFASGAAGLVYELVWSRYLALLLGHSAEAQVLVIGMFLGGMSVGAWLVSRMTRRVRRPLLAYVTIEGLLAAIGISYHGIYVLITDLAYGSLFPSLGPAGIGAARWTIASLMVFLPSILLGATFPLIASVLTRNRPGDVGGEVATLYFVNSFGGAVGVLLAGFGLIVWLGMPGTLRAAAMLNLLAAGLALLARDAEAAPPTPRVSGRPLRVRALDQTDGTGRLWGVLLAISGLTAVASFTYEIGWIRMLSLVMGSATHSFELMLSAFILGLAIGALIIRRRADRTQRPLRLLGWIQWAMGVAALATLPIYAASFGWIGNLMAELPATDAGYVRFNLARYGLALAVMLPSTILAGMTLPLITAALLRTGHGERAIGAVYSANTAGSIIGVLAAGLWLMPLLGLKGLLLVGAGLDIALGVWLLARTDLRETGSGRARPGPGRWPAAWMRPTAWLAGGAAVMGLLLASWVPLDRSVLTGGVFRDPTSDLDRRPVLYYADGRTATVGVHRDGPDSLVVLTTNGKPDASLTARWIRAAGGAATGRAPILQQDESTQMLTALVTHAHHPGARRAAIVGHGSGMTAQFLLAAPGLDSLVTIEIEPRVIDASRAYDPANRRVFDDPRSRIVIADARSRMVTSDQPWDLILSEPSNPWVSGTAALFSREFYGHVKRWLAPDGVFGQWFHVYETTDELVLSILSALDAEFGDYRAYLVGDTDLLLVATPGTTLAEPDWSALESPGVRGELAHVLPLGADHLRGLIAFRRAEMSPLLSRWPVVNSDYDPVLDLGAERARFRQQFAHGTYELVASRFRVGAALGGWSVPPAARPEIPIPGLAPLRGRAVAFRVRTMLADSAPEPPEAEGGLEPELRAARRLYGTLTDPAEWTGPVVDWPRWLRTFLRLEAALHYGTAGYADPAFYEAIYAAMDREDAPGPVRQTVDFIRGYAAHDWDRVAAVVELLVARRLGPADEWTELLDPALLLDGGVAAMLASGNPAGARRVFERMAPLSGRAPDDLRILLLAAHLQARERDGGGPAQIVPDR